MNKYNNWFDMNQIPQDEACLVSSLVCWADQDQHRMKHLTKG